MLSCLNKGHPSTHPTIFPLDFPFYLIIISHIPLILTSSIWYLVKFLPKYLVNSQECLFFFIHVVCIWCSGGHWFSSCRGLGLFLCQTLVSCWWVHFSHFITELKIHHLYSVNNNVRYTEIFRSFLPGISAPFDFPPGISEIFDWMVHFLEI